MSGAYGNLEPVALYRKYRPGSFGELVGEEQVTVPLSAALNNGRINHAYLFSGPRGCGKTSSARIMARSLNCVNGPTATPCGKCNSCISLAANGPGNLDVTELDAASHNGVDDMRELRDRAMFAPAESRYRIFIIDEAHMITNQGSNALLKIVEEPPAHLIFIFATTEPEKVIGTIRSRTHHYPFRLLTPQVMRGLLERTIAAEGVTVEDAVYPLVIRAGGGSPRDTLSVLDQLLAGSGPDGLTYQHARMLLGATDDALIDAAVMALAADDKAGLFTTVDDVIEAGLSPRKFSEDLLDRLRDLMLLQAVPDALNLGLVDAPTDRGDILREQAHTFDSQRIPRIASILNDGLSSLKGATSPRLLLEILCAKMLIEPTAIISGAPLTSGATTETPGITPAAPAAPAAGSKYERPSVRRAREAAAAARAAESAKTATPPAPAETTKPAAPQPPQSQPEPAQPSREEAAPQASEPRQEQPQPTAPAAAPEAEKLLATEGRLDVEEHPNTEVYLDAEVHPEPAESVAPEPAPQEEPEPTPAPQTPEPVAQFAPEPEPAAQPETPVNPIEQVKEAWGKIRSTVSKTNSVAGILLAEARPLGIKDNTLFLGHNTGALASRINAPEHNSAVQSAVTETTGLELGIRCEVGTNPKAFGFEVPAPKSVWNPKSETPEQQPEASAHQPDFSERRPEASEYQPEPSERQPDSFGSALAAVDSPPEPQVSASRSSQPATSERKPEPSEHQPAPSERKPDPSERKPDPEDPWGEPAKLGGGPSEPPEPKTAVPQQPQSPQRPQPTRQVGASTSSANGNGVPQPTWREKARRGAQNLEAQRNAPEFSDGTPAPPEPAGWDDAPPPPDEEYLPPEPVAPDGGAQPAAAAAPQEAPVPQDEEAEMMHQAATEAGEHDHRSAMAIATALVEQELGGRVI